MLTKRQEDGCARTGKAPADSSLPRPRTSSSRREIFADIELCSSLHMTEGSTSKNYPGVKGLGLQAFVPGEVLKDVQAPLDDNNDGSRSNGEVDELVAERGRRRETDNTKGKEREGREEQEESGETETFKGDSGAAGKDENDEPEDQFERDKKAFGSFLEELEDDESQDRLLAWIAGKLKDTVPAVETNIGKKERGVFRPERRRSRCPCYPFDQQTSPSSHCLHC